MLLDIMRVSGNAVLGRRALATAAGAPYPLRSFKVLGRIHPDMVFDLTLEALEWAGIWKTLKAEGMDVYIGTEKQRIV